MELQRRQDQSPPQRKGRKRKLEQEIDDDREISTPSGETRKALLLEVSAQFNILNSTFSWNEADRASAKRATHVLADLAKNGKKFMFCYDNLLSDLVVLSDLKFYSILELSRSFKDFDSVYFVFCRGRS